MPTGPTEVDLAIRAGVLVADAVEPPRHDVVVLVDGGEVVAIVDDGDGHRDAGSAYAPRDTLDARAGVVTPGLVNAHTHLALSFARGLTHRGGEPVYDVFWPLESHLSPDDVASFAALSAAESLLAGVTTVLDHYVHAEATEAVTTSLGLRAWIGETVMTDDGPFSDGSLARAVAHCERRRDPGSLATPVIAPHALDTVDVGTLVELAAMADRSGLPLHLHLAQSTRELETIAARDGCGAVQLADRLGYLARRAVLAHCSHLAPGDEELLGSSRGPVAVYCPTVHAMDGHVMPLVGLHAAGCGVAVGTDATPNETYAPLSEARGAVLGQRQSGAVLHPATALGLVTSALSELLDAPGLGRVTVGAPADLAVWDGSVPPMAMADEPVVALVMSPPPVLATVVAGRVLVDDGVLVDTDLAGLREDAVAHRRALLGRAGLA